VLLEHSLFNKLGSLRGDSGARTLLTDAPVRIVACDELGSDLDVDTVVDLAHRAGSAPELNRSSQRLGL
jgi:CTP:molybdopterin cytidylyltransferase MocA